MKKLILIFFSVYFVSITTNASNLTCEIEQVSKEELSALLASPQSSQTTEYFKCDEVFFSQIQKSQASFCFFDEFVVDERGAVKLGRYWGAADNCQSHSSSQFLFFEEYDDSKNSLQVERTYEIWLLLKEQKASFLRANVGWYNRNFNKKFSAFFDNIDASSEEVRIYNTIKYDLTDKNLMSFTVSVGENIWLVDICFTQDIKITGIYRVVI